MGMLPIGIQTPQVELLDRFPAAMAFSCQKVSKSYSGNWIRVVRTSDSDELDIPFKGLLPDVAALLAFTGTGGSDGGRVKTWYGQAGWDAAQSTQSRMPWVVRSGALEKSNGWPTIYFDGANVLEVNAASYGVMRNKAYGVILGVQRYTLPAATTGNTLMISIGTGQTARFTSRVAAAAIHRVQAQARVLDADTTTTLAHGTSMDGYVGQYQHTSEAKFSDGVLNSRVNNGALTATTAMASSGNTSDADSQAIRIGARTNLAGDAWTGYISELLVYNTSQTAQTILRLERSQMHRFRNIT
jgi:hypothetical protein